MTTGKARSYAILGGLAAAVLAAFMIAGVFLALGGLASALSGVMGPSAAQLVVGGAVVLVFGGGMGYAAWKYWPRR